MQQVESGFICAQELRSSFSRAAITYDAAALIQRHIADELLSLVPVTSGTLLDLGCGTGYCLGQLQTSSPNANLVGLDLAAPMAARCAQTKLLPTLCADAHQLPLQNDSIQIMVSSLMMQWSKQLPQLFAEAARVLVPGGQLVFNSLLPGTLVELEQAWARVDDDIHVNRFYSAQGVTDAARSAGFYLSQTQQQRYTFYFESPREVMQQIKSIGGHNINLDRRRTLMGKNKFSQFVQAYERLRQPQGLPISYQVFRSVARLPD